jgi:putative Ca2+/H+ antiporter (TMEM165/GDT1 family)
LEAFLVSAGVVALAEIGDKTQLLALLLATRFRKPLPIVLGILVATLANHAGAGAIGSWLMSVVGAQTMRWVLGLSFIAMALWALLPDSPPDEKSAAGRYGIFATTAIATVALAAQFHSLVMVVLGTTLGMLLANVPVVYLGDALIRRVPLKLIRAVAALTFLALGVYVLI